MGQRLNIEINNNGQVLANAYYHWSAYTLTSLELVAKVLSAYNKISLDTSEAVGLAEYQEKAVWALQSTGAGLPDDEREVAVSKGFTNLADCHGRNNGLIAITHKGIQETRFWEEERATIYLDEERVDFDVWFKQRRWEYDEDCEDYGNPKFEALPVVEWNLGDIKFKDFALFKSFINEMYEEGKLVFKTEQYPLDAYGLIE